MDFIIDEYTKVRGDPQALKLCCRKCGKHLMDYQKDGPGPLKRCYLDRIHWSEGLVKENYYCKGCGTEIGKIGLYEKEQRPALILMEQALVWDEE